MLNRTLLVRVCRFARPFGRCKAAQNATALPWRHVGTAIWIVYGGMRAASRQEVEVVGLWNPLVAYLDSTDY